MKALTMASRKVSLGISTGVKACRSSPLSSNPLGRSSVIAFTALFANKINAPLYDVHNDNVTGITEHPLIVMDGTLFDYMKLSVEDAKELVMRLKRRCFEVEGDFVVLWHNHTTTREFGEYYQEVYLPLVSS